MNLEIPSIVQVETSRACNARCSFCARSTDKFTTLPRMSDTLFEKIVNECAGWGGEPGTKLDGFYPFLNNEPFLDPRIGRFSKMVNDRLPWAGLTFFTNGSCFTHEVIESIAGVRISQLAVSLHSTSEEQYQREVGLDFASTLTSIKRIISAITDGSVSVDSMWFVRVSDGDAERDEEFRSFCNSTFPGFKVVIGMRYNWKGDVASPWKASKAFNTPCGRMNGLMILSSGVVALCCMDENGEYPLGDVNSQSLLEIYNGPKRRCYTSKKRRDIQPCDMCNMN